MLGALVAHDSQAKSPAVLEQSWHSTQLRNHRVNCKKVRQSDEEAVHDELLAPLLHVASKGSTEPATPSKLCQVIRQTKSELFNILNVLSLCLLSP